jgi:hypothetical protein
MRIANVYPFPVRVRVNAAQGVLSVRLEGAGKPHPVEWSKQVLSRTRAGVQEVANPDLDPGQTQLIQEAIDGLTLLRKRTVYLPTGPKVEESVLRYPANDRIVAVSGSGEYSGSSLRIWREFGMEDF